MKETKEMVTTRSSRCRTQENENDNVAQRVGENTESVEHTSDVNTTVETEVATPQEVSTEPSQEHHKTREKKQPRKKINKKDTTRTTRQASINIVVTPLQKNTSSSLASTKKLKKKNQQPPTKEEHDVNTPTPRNTEPDTGDDEETRTEDDDDEDVSTSTEEEIEEDDDDEDFEMPLSIEDDATLVGKFEDIVQDIKDEIPTMEMILTTPMRKRNRRILFEWYHIYKNIQPCTQERMEVRSLLKKLFEEYTQEYDKYRQHKKEIRELEKHDEKENSLCDLSYQILGLTTTDENKRILYRKFKEMKEKGEEERDDEYFKMKQWLQWALRMPYDRTKEFPMITGQKGALTTFLQQLRRELDQTLYGMSDVKDQIMLFVHHKIVHPQMKGCSLGLVGDPGVGKTSIARCLARVMDFPFEQISFGGIRSTEHLKGFDYTYVGSQPGEIAKCLSRMGYKNGILFLDEYEKVSENNDVNSFLLHLTDFSQNSVYRDNYLGDVTMDLSCLWLIYSMNQLPDDKALRDRIFCVNVSGYTSRDKVNIIKNFLLPKHVRAQDLDPTSITIDDETASYVVEFVRGHEKGIRRIEQFIKDIVFKISFLVHHQDQIGVSFYPTTPLEYPVMITRQLIECLSKDFHKTLDQNDTSHMYV